MVPLKIPTPTPAPDQPRLRSDRLESHWPPTTRSARLGSGRRRSPISRPFHHTIPHSPNHIPKRESGAIWESLSSARFASARIGSAGSSSGWLDTLSFVDFSFRVTEVCRLVSVAHTLRSTKGCSDIVRRTSGASTEKRQDRNPKYVIWRMGKARESGHISIQKNISDK